MDVAIVTNTNSNDHSNQKGQKQFFQKNKIIRSGSAPNRPLIFITFVTTIITFIITLSTSANQTV